MQCKLLVVGYFAFILGFRLVLADYEDMQIPEIDEVQVPQDSEAELLTEGIDYSESVGNHTEVASSPPTNVHPTHSNCTSKADEMARKAAEEFDSRFKDTFTWDLSINQPCGPEKRCDYTHRFLKCKMDPEDRKYISPICACDNDDPKHSQWSETRKKCLRSDNSTCENNRQCASSNCTNEICQIDDDNDDLAPTEGYASKASVIFPSEILFQSEVFIAWFAILGYYY